jgi:hypothetical protein
MIQSKKIFSKSYYLCKTNKEITQIPKSESKKFSILCTFKLDAGQNSAGAFIIIEQGILCPVNRKEKKPNHA